MIVDISKQALVFYAAQLTANIDLKVGIKQTLNDTKRDKISNQWTMYLYDNLDKIDINFIMKLEKKINCHLKKMGYKELYLEDII